MAKIIGNSNTQVITNKVRLSYANVWEPKSIKGSEPKSIKGSEPKYSCSLLIPKSDTETVNCIKQAIQNAYENGKNVLAGSGKTAPELKLIKTPLRDGDEERPDDEAYKGMYFINATSKNKPGIVDRNKEKIEDPTEVYSGCYVRASINMYAFSVSGNRGIACGLNNLQKVSDGDSLMGRTSAANDFDALEDEDDDFLA